MQFEIIVKERGNCESYLSFKIQLLFCFRNIVDHSVDKSHSQVITRKSFVSSLVFPGFSLPWKPGCCLLLGLGNISVLWFKGPAASQLLSSTFCKYCQNYTSLLSMGLFVPQELYQELQTKRIWWQFLLFEFCDTAPFPGEWILPTT